MGISFFSPFTLTHKNDSPQKGGLARFPRSSMNRSKHAERHSCGDTNAHSSSSPMRVRLGGLLGERRLDLLDHAFGREGLDHVVVHARLDRLDDAGLFRFGR